MPASAPPPSPAEKHEQHMNTTIDKAKPPALQLTQRAQQDNATTPRTSEIFSSSQQSPDCFRPSTTSHAMYRKSRQNDLAAKSVFYLRYVLQPSTIIPQQQNTYVKVADATWSHVLSASTGFLLPLMRKLVGIAIYGPCSPTAFLPSARVPLHN